MTTIKWLVLLFVSTSVGTFFGQIMESTDMNVWIARIGGCVVSVIVALLLYKYFSKEKTAKE